MPYCTGDVHIGNRNMTYIDQTGAQPPLPGMHAGHNNTLAAIQWARGQFPSVDKLLVTGFSAGGTATAAGYFFVRNGINPQRGYYLDDSGPIFPAPDASFNSRPLHDPRRVGARHRVRQPAIEVQSQRLRQHQPDGRARAPRRSDRVHRLHAPLQLLAVLVRAIPDPDRQGVGTRILGRGPGQPGLALAADSDVAGHVRWRRRRQAGAEVALLGRDADTAAGSSSSIPCARSITAASTGGGASATRSTDAVPPLLAAMRLSRLRLPRRRCRRRLRPGNTARPRRAR